MTQERTVIAYLKTLKVANQGVKNEAEEDHKRDWGLASVSSSRP